MISSYDFVSKNETNISTSFKLEGVPVALANSIRRILLSNIPVAEFDDTWHYNPDKRSILIHKNTSGIHNEFLSHRISLLPITMYNNDHCKIQTKYDNDKCIRKYSFANLEKVPIFQLKVKNNSETRDYFKTTSLITLTSNDLKIKNKETGELESASDYILPDPYTMDYCVLDVLKPNILNDEDGEEIDLIATPTIGIGLMNARYTPVGTVSYMFEIDEDEQVDRVFNLQIDYKNKEREKKKLQPLSRDEKNKMKKSFSLLDRERVYKTDTYGEANVFKFNVESIGFLSADQLVLDSFYMLELMLRDILNSIHIQEKDSECIFTFNENKISITDTYDDLMGFYIKLENENHTIGNLISEYFKLFYCRKDPLDCNIITFASYRMPHPLKEQIELKVKLNPTLKDLPITNVHHKLSEIFLNRKMPISNKNSLEKQKDIITMIFIKTVYSILDSVNSLRLQWGNINHKQLNESSFIILDNEDYYMLYNNIDDDFTISSLLE